MTALIGQGRIDVYLIFYGEWIFVPLFCVIFQNYLYLNILQNKMNMFVLFVFVLIHQIPHNRRTRDKNSKATIDSDQY